jgi:site-specific recombinase XerD
MTTTKHSSFAGDPVNAGAEEAREALVAAFLHHLRSEGYSGWSRRYRVLARHFLLWLDLRGIPLVSVDETIIARFARHRCCCPRYSSPAFGSTVYLSHVRRFIRFLEDRGEIPVVDDLAGITGHLAAFAGRLGAEGYSVVSQRGYRFEAEHFACWLRLSRVRWHDVNDIIISHFGQHRCRCPIHRNSGILVKVTGAAHRRRGARRFLRFLEERGAIIPASAASGPIEEPRLSAFRSWLKRDRGLADRTVQLYLREASRWLAGLGADPTAYDAATIRSVVMNQAPLRSHGSVRMTTTVLRSYLRFVAARGECRPELVHAVLPARCRRLAILPRYASPAVIEQVIESCDVTTPVGTRHRAIILLLARLGLRAGEVSRLRLSDIDWANALLYVHGKGGRPARLPLPQDVGEAVLAYLARVRPKVREQRIFLRIRAPFAPLASKAISSIAARLLKCAGVKGVPMGAHLFRHSLATSMLRAGASLESVGTVLRHRLPSTTAIYAKVNVAMLERVAQPWPGDASC